MTLHPSRINLRKAYHRREERKGGYSVSSPEHYRDKDFGVALDRHGGSLNIDVVPAAGETLDLGYTTLKEQLMG
jgi:hypothetical protein